MTELPSPGTRVVINLDPSADPIAGTVRIDGDEHAFVGWLDLINALEDARAGAAGHTSDAIQS